MILYSILSADSRLRPANLSCCYKRRLSLAGCKPRISPGTAIAKEKHRRSFEFTKDIPYHCYGDSLLWVFRRKINSIVTMYKTVIPMLAHWGRVTHICVRKLTIIGSDNALSPGRCQAMIWNNAGLLLIEPLGTNFSEIWIRIQTFSFKKMHLKMASAKWRPFCLGLNVLKL